MFEFSFSQIRDCIVFGDQENIDEGGYISNNDSSNFLPIIIDRAVALIVIVIIIIIAVVLLRRSFKSSLEMPDETTT